MTDTIASLTARIAALEAENARLLKALGGHYCHDWDGLAVWPGTPEAECCTCQPSALHPSPDDRAKVDIAEECARIAGGFAKENDTGSGFDSQVAYTTARRIERDIRARFGRPA